MMTTINAAMLALILAAGAAGAQTVEEAEAAADIALEQITIEEALDIARAQEAGDVIALNRDFVSDVPVFEIETEGDLVNGHHVVDARNGDLLLSGSERVLNAESEALFIAEVIEEEDAMLAAAGMSDEEIDGLSEVERDAALRAAAEADFPCDDE